jgi:hypothetical protein
LATACCFHMTIITSMIVGSSSASVIGKTLPCSSPYGLGRQTRSAAAVPHCCPRYGRSALYGSRSRRTRLPLTDQSCALRSLITMLLRPYLTKKAMHLVLNGLSSRLPTGFGFIWPYFLPLTRRTSIASRHAYPRKAGRGLSAACWRTSLPRYNHSARAIFPSPLEKHNVGLQAINDARYCWS